MACMMRTPCISAGFPTHFFLSIFRFAAMKRANNNRKILYFQRTVSKELKFCYLSSSKLLKALNFRISFHSISIIVLSNSKHHLPLCGNPKETINIIF